MNLFEAIEGLRGENLMSAVIRVLLLRSLDLRTAFIGAISEVSDVGPIAASSCFSCRVEESTSDPTSGRGRIDLTIETDTAVVGIESKLFAAFQDGQPEKYIDALRKRAELLTEIRRTTVHHLVAVLIPEARRKEVEGKNCAILSWENLLKQLAKAATDLDRRTQAIWESFREFVTRQIAFLPDYDSWRPHLRRFEPKGSSIQREFLGKI